MKKALNIVLRILGILLVVPHAWEEKAPDFSVIIQKMTKFSKKPEKSRFFPVTNQQVHYL